MKKKTHRVPKRHVRRRLGPFSSITAFPSRFVCPGVGVGDAVVVVAVVVIVVDVVVWCVCIGSGSLWSRCDNTRHGRKHC